MFDFKYFFVFVRWWVLCLGALCVWPAATAAAATSRDDAEIQRWIEQHAQRANRIEVPGERYRVVGDLDGDGMGDVALLYTLKSRAGESRYLAAFKRHAEKAGGRRDARLRYHAHVLVSGPGAGEANRVTILSRIMVVEMRIFAPGDAACCPTRAATRRYRLGARGLTLVATEAPWRKS